MKQNHPENQPFLESSSRYEGLPFIANTAARSIYIMAHEFDQRHGANPSAKDCIKSADLITKGAFLLFIFIVIGIPETGLHNLKKGISQLLTFSHKSNES